MYLGESCTADLLERALRNAPDQMFLVTETRALTFRQFHNEVSRAAAGLERLGVRRGDCVMIALNSSVEYPVALFALHALGATSVNVNPGYSEEEINFVCDHSRSRFVIGEAAMVEALRRATGNRPLILVGATARGDDATKWQDIVATAPQGPLKRPGVTADDPATVLYTSGTTSRPKGVVFRQGSHGFAGEYMTRNLGLKSSDVYYCIFPLFHSNAISNGIFPMLTVQGTFVFKKFSASRFIDEVIDHQATVSSGGVPHWRMINAQAEKRGLKGPLQKSRLRVVLSGGPMRDDEYDNFETLFGCRIVEIFGQTEGVVPCTIHPPYGAPRKRRSAGPPGLGSEVRIALESGNFGKPHETGEIQFRTHGAGARMLGYLHQPAETAKLFSEDGWIRSGDLGYLDEEGWLYFVDRAKDMIKVGGENVAASEVERVLDEHPDVKESAAVPFPDPVLGQVVGAYVVMKAGATIDADGLIAYCKTKLAKFKVPTVIREIETLPRNALGKVAKIELPR